MRNYLLLAAIAAVLFFFNLGGAHLWDVDEAIFSEAGKEMYTRGDLVVPTYNGQVFPDKPAMMYWLMISAYELFGPSEFAARFWSAVFGIASVLLTCRVGTLIFSPSVGFFSGLVLATNLYFNVIARAATPDSFLVFFSTLVVMLFVAGTRPSGQRAAKPGGARWAEQSIFEPTWGTYALMYTAMGFGVLTKGPIGVLLPTSVIGLFLLVMRAQPVESTTGGGWRGALGNAARWVARVFSIKHIARTTWSMRPLTALAIVLAVAAPWYALVALRTGGQWSVGFFAVHNFGRFLQPMEHHNGSILYYLVAIAIGFFPWSVLFGPGWLFMREQVRERRDTRNGYVLACSWAAVWVGFFSLAATKLPNYVLPAYPALALFTGAFVDHWLREPATVSRLWTRLVWGTVALVGLGMAIGLPIAAHLVLHDDWMLGALGLIPLVAAVAGMVYSERGQARGAVGALSTLGVVLALGLFGFGAIYVDRYQDSPKIAEFIAQQTPEGERPTIASFHYLPPSFVFYTGQTIQPCTSRRDVLAFFEKHPSGAYMLTTDGQFANVRASLPSDIQVLQTQPRFLRSGSVVLLGRDTHWSTAATPSQPDSPAALQ